MDVSVLSKRGQRPGQTTVRPSLLGGGMLERARSTTFALLGVTAAVGLAMVALALNQSWPLVPGSAIPGPLGQAKIGEATVAAGALPERSGGGDEGTGTGAPRQARGPVSPSGGSAAGVAPPAGATDFVVSQSTPVSAQGGDGPAGAPKSTPPAAQQPEQVVEAPVVQAPPAQSAAPSPTPAVTAPTAPPAASAEAPAAEEEEPESEDPSEGDSGEGEDWDGDGWHGHGHGGWHGHRWGD